MTYTPALIAEEYPLDDRLAQVQEQLQEDLAQVRERLCALVAPPHHKIQDPIMYAVEHTGRLLRPSLVLLSSYLLEGETGAATHRRVIDAAAAVEILHIATLHHDDLIDDAQVRRGRSTTNAKYGDAIALLTGDYLLARCMQAAASLGASRMMSMAETLIDVCVGQMLESSQLFDPLRTEEDYLVAVSGKTARLMRTATAMGALQCNASTEVQDALESFGHNLGMAFQIWDDILDICSEETGKQVAKDLLNGVYTLPVIYAIEDFPDRLLPALREQPLSADRCQEILSLMHECGAISRAADVAQRHVTDALRAVESHPSFVHRAPVIGRYLRNLVDRLASQHPALRAQPGTARSGTARSDTARSSSVRSDSEGLPSYGTTKALIHDWLNGYIAQPNDRLGRGGAVCPFVAPSLRAGSLEIQVRTVGSAPVVGTVIDMVHHALDEFDLIEWEGSNPALRSLLVAMPDLAPTECHLLDEAHRAVKSAAVRRGMMIGQFHPLCEEPAARNPGFRVNRSPVPLVAIRPMALHDILFLKDRKDWFDEYHRRFGSHYKPSRDAIEPLFVELFQRACAEHGVGA
ncbi:polyprenyl synthetase family protein [Streptomyces sp. NBS 14/10]|uniref:polyprenyl synthetase family protein n=1 Tax=Streptomyces sp. NBS 14/10 TaxID=1945643 RepID=UPI000B7D8539|nr:polyprenyl synthetase family protein [Streptomyces sp. NBS 14/10]KAK1184905.1 polyprenyl synthetase family protein [Streptomyces sp. NBS 14/10]